MLIPSSSILIFPVTNFDRPNREKRGVNYPLSPHWLRFFGLSYAMDGVIRNETLIETDMAAIFVNCFRLERTNQLNLLSGKDLVDLCHPIEPYQVTKNLDNW